MKQARWGAVGAPVQYASGQRFGQAGGVQCAAAQGRHFHAQRYPGNQEPETIFSGQSHSLAVDY